MKLVTAVIRPERIQQVQVGCRNAFTTHFPSRKFLLLHQRDRPASLRQPYGDGGAGRATPDNDGVIVGFHHQGCPCCGSRSQTPRSDG